MIQMMNVKKELEKYFETDLVYVRVGLDKETDTKRRGDICWYAIQRALGAVQLAQMLGLPFSEAEPMYENYKAILEDLQYDC